MSLMKNARLISLMLLSIGLCLSLITNKVIAATGFSSTVNFVHAMKKHPTTGLFAATRNFAFQSISRLNRHFLRSEKLPFILRAKSKKNGFISMVVSHNRFQGARAKNIRLNLAQATTASIEISDVGLIKASGITDIKHIADAESLFAASHESNLIKTASKIRNKSKI